MLGFERLGSGSPSAPAPAPAPASSSRPSLAGTDFAPSPSSPDSSPADSPAEDEDEGWTVPCQTVWRQHMRATIGMDADETGVERQRKGSGRSMKGGERDYKC